MGLFSGRSPRGGLQGPGNKGEVDATKFVPGSSNLLQANEPSGRSPLYVMSLPGML